MLTGKEEIRSFCLLLLSHRSPAHRRIHCWKYWTQIHTQANTICTRKSHLLLLISNWSLLSGNHQICSFTRNANPFEQMEQAGKHHKSPKIKVWRLDCHRRIVFVNWNKDKFDKIARICGGLLHWSTSARLLKSGRTKTQSSKLSHRGYPTCYLQKIRKQWLPSRLIPIFTTSAPAHNVTKSQPQPHNCGILGKVPRKPYCSDKKMKEARWDPNLVAVNESSKTTGGSVSSILIANGRRHESSNNQIGNTSNWGWRHKI